MSSRMGGGRVRATNEFIKAHHGQFSGGVLDVAPSDYPVNPLARGERRFDQPQQPGVLLRARRHWLLQPCVTPGTTP